MATGNSVALVGNLTRDPELRFTPSGQATTAFGLAVNRRWQNRQTSEWEESVSFFDIVCWTQMAENVAASMGKGDRVVVSGHKRSKTEITADEVAPSLRWATVTATKNERTSGPEGTTPGGPQGAAQDYPESEDPF